MPLVEEKTITQPFGDRSKVVIEPMLTDQWFVDTAKIVGPALDAVRDGRTTHRAGAAPQGLFPLAREYRALDHLAAALVGAPDPGLVRLRPRAARLPTTTRATVRSTRWRCFGCSMRRPCWRARTGIIARRISTASSAQFADVLGGLPTPLNHARVVEVADRHEAAHMLGASLAQYGDGPGPRRSWSIRSGATPTCSTRGSPLGLWPIGTLGWPEDTPELHRYFPTSTLVFGLRHHLLLGRPDDDDATGRHGRGAVPRRLCPRPSSATRRGARCPRASATCSTRWSLWTEYGADALRFTLTLDGRDGARPEAQPRPHPGLPQLRHQAVECRTFLPR